MAHSGQMQWVVDEVEEKMNKVYKGKQLESLKIVNLDCKSWVANEVFDLMLSLELAYESFKNLALEAINQ